VIFLILWLIIYSRIDYSTMTTDSINNLWQSLGVENLAVDPLSSLSVLHIQPWGVNALYALDLAVSPSSHVLLLLVYFLAGAGSIWLLVSTLALVGVPRSWRVGAGVVLALLPGTVYYTFWPYNVTLTGFFVTLMAWGLATMARRPMLGAGVSAGAVLALQLTRSTFVWVVVLAWCVFLAVRLVRMIPGRKVLVTLVPLLVVAGLSAGSQLYYWANFQLPTMSSWSGQNVAKALFFSGNLNVTSGAREEINQDPCLGELLVAFETQTINIWDPGGQLALPACSRAVVPEPKGIPAWDQNYRESGPLNFNSRTGLAASREWSRMMFIIVKNDPTQLIDMALTTPTGPRSSGVGLYLDPSDEFPWIDAEREASPVAPVSGLLSVVFGPAMVVLILLGVIHAIARRDSYLRGNWVYWGVLGLIVFHAGTSTLAEWGENMRFRAEIDPVLLLLAVMSLYAISQSKQIPGLKSSRS